MTMTMTVHELAAAMVSAASERIEPLVQAVAQLRAQPAVQQALKVQP